MNYVKAYLIKIGSVMPEETEFVKSGSRLNLDNSLLCNFLDSFPFSDPQYSCLYYRDGI